MTKNALLTYKYLSLVKMRGKGRSSVILIKRFNPFLAPVVLGAVTGFHHLMAHGTTVGGISPLRLRPPW